MELSKFEADLMRLHWIGVRLEVLYNGFYGISSTDKDVGWFKNALREYMVIQLHNFLKLRNSIKNHSQETIFFDKCLEPYWKSIDQHKIAIRELRNSYFAHMQEKKPFEKSIQEIIDINKFPNYFGDILFLTGCAYLYFNSFRNYFKKEYDLARKKYKAFTPAMISHGEILESQVPKKLDVVTKLVNEKITKNLEHLKSFGRISGIMN